MQSKISNALFPYPIVMGTYQSVARFQLRDYPQEALDKLRPSSQARDKLQSHGYHQGWVKHIRREQDGERQQ